MSDFRLEKIEMAKLAYTEAGARTNDSLISLVMSQSAELQEAERLKWAYDNAFTNGFIITRVVDPSQLEFLIGHREYDQGFGSSWTAETATADETHAEAMIGRHALSVEVEVGYSARNLIKGTEIPKMPTPTVRFNLSGILDNSPTAYRDRFDVIHRKYAPFTRTSIDLTQYRGKLAAIEWRLPTDEEVADFGQVPVTS